MEGALADGFGSDGLKAAGAVVRGADPWVEEGSSGCLFVVVGTGGQEEGLAGGQVGGYFVRWKIHCLT